MTTTTQDTGERWLVAARLSRMSKRDQERGDALITGIQTQDEQSTKWILDQGGTIAHVTKDKGVSGGLSRGYVPSLAHND